MGVWLDFFSAHKCHAVDHVDDEQADAAWSGARDVRRVLIAIFHTSLPMALVGGSQVTPRDFDAGSALGARHARFEMPADVLADDELAFEIRLRLRRRSRIGCNHL